jgi:hypothetical protein
VPELASNYSGQNSVAFTPVQTEAIYSALSPGLTLVVGPPGTGKTDVAVQAITLLLRNFPSARMLLVTHSNAALNDLFEKLLAGGMVIVTTSTRPPEDLYKNGLNRALFLPFIALLRDRLEVLELASPHDYRQHRRHLLHPHHRRPGRYSCSVQ